MFCLLRYSLARRIKELTAQLEAATAQLDEQKSSAAELQANLTKEQEKCMRFDCTISD